MKRAWTLILCGVSLGVVLIAGTANGTGTAATRTFVSGAGADSGSCTVTAPCRSFAYAITQTAAGGEITVLSSAGYGAVSITGSITITNPGGVEAGVTASSGASAISIAASSSDIVTLRGLTLEGGGVGSHGINTTAVGTLNIIDAVAKDFTGSGIVVEPSSGTTNVLIADTFALNNGESGINLDATGSGAVQFTIARTTAAGNVYGISLDATASGSRIDGLIVDSHADSNSNVGIDVTGSGPNAPGCDSAGGGTNVYVVVQNSSAVNNRNNGIEATGTAINGNGPFSGAGVVITGSTFINDGVGDVYGNCGMVFSAGDNIFFIAETGTYGGGVGIFSKH